MRRSAWVLCVVLSAGCGYRFVVANAQLPRGVRSVAVPMFSNRTSEPQAEAHFTQALRALYQQAGLLAGGAEATVEGVVLSVSSGPFLAAPERGQFPVSALTATVQLSLKRGEQELHRVVVSGSEDYPSGADLLLTEAQRAAALRRLAETLMRDGAEKLAIGW